METRKYDWHRIMTPVHRSIIWYHELLLLIGRLQMIVCKTNLKTLYSFLHRHGNETSLTIHKLQTVVHENKKAEQIWVFLWRRKPEWPRKIVSEHSLLCWQVFPMHAGSLTFIAVTVSIRQPSQQVLTSSCKQFLCFLTQYSCKNGWQLEVLLLI